MKNFGLAFKLSYLFCQLDSLEYRGRGDKVKLVMELFAEFVLIKGVQERLVELFFIQLVGLHKKILDFRIIVFLPLLVLENT
jgi:hypothetical protein